MSVSQRLCYCGCMASTEQLNRKVTVNRASTKESFLSFMSLVQVRKPAASDCVSEDRCARGRTKSHQLHLLCNQLEPNIPSSSLVLVTEFDIHSVCCISFNIQKFLFLVLQVGKAIVTNLSVKPSSMKWFTRSLI